MNKELLDKSVKALVHSLLSILSFIFVTPLKLWIKAAERLSAQKEAGSLNLTNIHSEWPMLTYIKRFTLDFYFDAAAFLAYPLGILWAIWCGIDSAMYASHLNEMGADSSVFAAFITSLLVTLIVQYFTPVLCYIAHDLCVVILLPIRKLIDWFKKPAQHMDLDIKNK
jgi:hypothetical protein